MSLVLEDVAAAARLQLADGDYLVVTYPQGVHLSDDDFHRLQDVLRPKVPEGVKILVFEDGATVSVIKAPQIVELAASLSQEDFIEFKRAWIAAHPYTVSLA